uniref:Peptidase M12A domain-containing protein n=1 Tax=Ditylenchus dipsaci TaxID=166011 RepID=A0A915DX61_9BILA
MPEFFYYSLPMGQSISKYSTLHKQLQLPSLMVEIFSDHYIDRLEALGTDRLEALGTDRLEASDTDTYVRRNIHLWPRSPDGEHYVPFAFAKNHFCDAQKEIIFETMELINENTCVKFIPSTRRQHALIIRGKPAG